MIQTIQQERAKFALEKVQEALKQSDIKHKEYSSYASSLPAMIHMNGLGQAAAFFRSKTSSKEHQHLYKLLSDWLTSKGKPYYEENDLLDGITSQGMEAYQLAQAEALVLMDWVKKFAKAFNQETNNETSAV